MAWFTSAESIGVPKRRLGFDAWVAVAVFIAAVVAAPVVAVAVTVLRPEGAVWSHLWATVLGRYAANSLLLMGGVGLGTLVIGVGTAWLVTMCRFPLRRVFEWALLLPLAVPAYVIAYTYTSLLDFAGPVQSSLRDAFGWSRGDYWFPPIRSLGGAVTMLTLVLYPYVYLLARAAFLEQSVCVLEVGRTLGRGPWGCFVKVALPLARPAIVTGIALALMETLNDFGTVQHFGVDTFTTGIYRTWLGLGEPIAAAQLAAVLMAFVLAVLVVERISRGDARYHHTSSKYRPLPRFPLSRWRAFLAGLACGLPILLGFAIPAAVLAGMTSEQEGFGDAEFWSRAATSFSLSAAAAIFAVLVAGVLAYALRIRPTRLSAGAARLAAMGYAVPGSVIAVGILLPLSTFDALIDGTMRQALGISTGLLLSGTVFAVLYAYLVRFLAVSLNTIEASLAKITRNMDSAARVLGAGPFATLRRVHAPLLTGGALTAALLVFVEVMKELPATLIMRPFGLETLAIRAYQMASDERLAEAAAPSLAIVLVGILPVFLLSRAIARSRPGHKEERS